ncbi:unnamed protein product [Linum trigynum]|uniref:S-protein homolog n=1 Tax=Linum trigynum TaxID=586398 RepID=A0AAV2CSK8_9ROSI
MFISQPGAGVVLTIMVIITMARPTIQEKIHVTNRLSNEILIAHCHSKDDDLGAHAIPIGEQISWEFGVTVGTYFWCDLAIKGKRLTFDSYDWFDTSKYSQNWDVRDEGVYGIRVSDGVTFFMAAWNQI